MNNSFARLIDGMCATLRAEVLPRLDDEFARGQVFGVINLLNTFKARADWSAGFLLQQIAAQQAAFEAIAAVPGAPVLPRAALPPSTPISELLARRDEGNAAIAAALHAGDLPAEVETLLRQAMRAEVDIELKNAPRPLFAEMSSGSEA
jgi:hypothetical protein